MTTRVYKPFDNGVDTLQLIDVRAPVEFKKGHWPNSLNLPILNDDERHQVGLAYANEGPEAATRLGHKLVSGAVKTARVEAWRSQLEHHQPAAIMCWRGGQRSAIAQQWLLEAGCSVERIQGGYKALRTQAIHTLDKVAADYPWLVLGGRTGVGKTEVIQALPQAIDLEKHAEHRGSAFGGYINPAAPTAPTSKRERHTQPGQATFENRLAVAWWRAQPACVIVEDESRTIGTTALPESWHYRMQQAPVVWLESSMEERAAKIRSEYVDRPQQSYSADIVEGHILQACKRISRRLGGVRHTRLSSLISHAFGGHCSHEEWITLLLSEYYDPMYDYQYEKKRGRICFSGEAEAVLEYLRQELADTPTPGS